MPKKPYTMDGMPARRFIGGMSHLKSFLGQNFAINMAVKSPIGTPIMIAPAVQYREPTIIGKIPYEAGTFLGLQSVPKRKFPTPISAIAGQPLANIKIHITITAATETQAQRKNNAFIAFSSRWELCFAVGF